jgi:LuxR family maltose regulon positive regulatory protein
MPPELASDSGLRPRLGEQLVPTVATKLVVPSTPGYLIIRKRLLDALDRGAQGPLVVLSAPAGAGKTILVSSWVQTRLPGPVAWLSLDGDDNDASRLAADLMSALRSASVIKRGSTLDRLDAPLGARADGFLATLVNGLSKLHSTFVLVLDDVHELTSPQACSFIDFLVRHAPSQCRLVLVGRADPPVPVQRLRVCGELTELRVADLAFDRDETATLYRQLGLELSEEELEVLWHRTEGWAAALRLAGLSLQGHPEPRRFVAEFAGTDRAVADYLVSEVLAHMPEDRRAFMLRTCLVDALSPELADALTGLDGASLTLDALERSGVPVQQTRANGLWYRYHPLFGELLRAHLHHSRPEELPLLHRRAAHWYAEQGLVRPAIRHALLGEDWEEAGRLIEENWLDLFLSGASSAVREPMAKLPADVIAAHPRLAVAFAGSRLEDGDMDSAQHYLMLARGASRDEREGAQPKLVLVAVALLRARLRADVEEARRHAEELARLARTPQDARWARLRSFALSNLGATLLWAGEPQLAGAHLREALALASEAGHEHIRLDCLAQLAIEHLLRGQLTQAGEEATSAVQLAERYGWEDGSAPACAYLAAANVAYWRAEFERAEGLVSRAVSAANTAELPVRLAARLLQALMTAAAGPQSATRGLLKLDALRAAIADGERVPEYLQAALGDIEIRLLLASDSVQVARGRLADARTRVAHSPSLLVREAEVELRAGEFERARKLTAKVLDQVEASVRAEIHPMTHLEALLVCALAEHAHGEHAAAADSLDRALALAEQEHWCGPFLLHGETMRELLERSAQSGTAHPALLETLLDGVGESQGTNTQGALAEPLTDREIRILRFLPTMLSNAEIGAETFVSLNTVKTHLRSIYRKLGARSRADAVQKARTLGLLPHGIRRPRVAQRASALPPH